MDSVPTGRGRADRLERAWGPSPWSTDRIIELSAEAQSCLNECSNSFLKDYTGLIYTTEMLEQLAWILSTSAAESIHTQWFKLRPNTPAERGGGLPPEKLQDMGLELCEQAQALKSALFKARQLPDVQPASAQPKVDGLCQFCLWAFERIGHGRLLEKESLPTGASIPDSCSYTYLCAVESETCPNSLQSRAEGGCNSCHSIRSTLGRGEATTDIDEKDWNPSRNTSIWLEVFWRMNKDQGTHVLYSLQYASFHRFVSVKGTGCRRQASSYYHVETSDESLRQALGIWCVPETMPLANSNICNIRDAVRSAESSSVFKPPSFTPTRLLDLGTNQDAHPRLVLLNEDRVKYVALSYCWGGPAQAAQQLKLTRENMDQFCNSIPLPSMSPVMRDAVKTCRALGVRYLWIDAVCIIQNSKVDWEEQSTQMAPIYTNSYLTICAASSSSCLDGFLDASPEREGFRICIPYTLPQVPGGSTVTLRFEPRSLAAIDQHPLALDLTNPACTWNSRAWTYQEKSLAPRKLIFGRSMIHYIGWQGITMSESKQYLRIYPTANYGPGQQGRGEGDRAIYPWNIVDNHFGPIHWQELVEQYSGMRWTFQADVLPALSGIASMYQMTGPYPSGQDGDQYLAGLWKLDLHCSLLWTPDDPRLVPHTTVASISDELSRVVHGQSARTVPSWSWASRQHRVRFSIARGDGRPVPHSRDALRPEYELLGVDYQVDGLNPLGRVKSASLTMSVKLLPLSDPGCIVPQIFDVGPSKRHVPLWKYSLGNEQVIHILPDWHWASQTGGVVSEEGISKLQMMLLSSCGSHTRALMSMNPELTMSEMPNIESFSLDAQGFYRYYSSSMYSNICIFCADARWRDIWGLLLCPADDSAERYFRVGIWFSYGETGGSPIFDNIERTKITLL